MDIHFRLQKQNSQNHYPAFRMTSRSCVSVVLQSGNRWQHRMVQRDSNTLMRDVLLSE